MKILVIRFSSIGDIVLCSPVVRCLKKQVNCEIHFLTKKCYDELVQFNPYIDKVMLLEDSLSDCIAVLKQEKYDLIVDLHNNLRSFRVKMALGVKSLTFNKLNFKKLLLTSLKINVLPKIHLIDRYFESLKEIKVEYDGEGLDFFIEPKEELLTADVQSISNENFLAVSVSAKFNTKALPLVKLIEVLRNLSCKIILLGGREDYPKAEAIAQQIDNCHNYCGKLSLQQSAWVISKASKVLVHDTGLMHIAAAFKKPMVLVWGNTLADFGMYPFYPTNASKHVEEFEVQGLKCRPCSKLGYAQCPKKHFNCMNRQNTLAIAKACSLD